MESLWKREVQLPERNTWDGSIKKGNSPVQNLVVGAGMAASIMI